MVIKLNYRKITYIFFYIYLIFIFVGLDPYSFGKAQFDITNTNSSNYLRQIIIVSFFLLFLFSYLRVGDFNNIFRNKEFIIFFAWVFISFTWSAAPETSIKRSTLLFINFMCVYCSISILNKQQAIRVLTNVFISLLLLSFLGVVLFSGAKHTASELIDSGIVGTWKGIYQHKNQAGPAMVLSIILYIYNYNMDKNRNWLIYIILSIIFLAFTQSKSSIFLAVPSLIFGYLFMIFVTKRNKMIINIYISLVVIIILSLSSYFSEGFYNLISDPESFTGRAQIWSILAQVIEDHLLVGLGFGTVWLTGDNMLVAEYIVGWNEWVYLVAHSHNGYIEVLVSLGVIGFIIFFVCFLYRPYNDGINLAKSSERFLFFSIFFFFIMHNLLETDFINSLDGRWIVFLFFILLARNKMTKVND